MKIKPPSTQGKGIAKRVWERIQLLFRSKADVARTEAERQEALQRKQMELERLDRLRHPSNYQGR